MHQSASAGTASLATCTSVCSQSSEAASDSPASARKRTPSSAETLVAREGHRAPRPAQGVSCSLVTSTFPPASAARDAANSSTRGRERLRRALEAARRSRMDQGTGDEADDRGRQRARRAGVSGPRHGRGIQHLRQVDPRQRGRAQVRRRARSRHLRSGTGRRSACAGRARASTLGSDRSPSRRSQAPRRRPRSAGSAIAVIASPPNSPETTPVCVPCATREAARPGREERARSASGSAAGALHVPGEPGVNGRERRVADVRDVHLDGSLNSYGASTIPVEQSSPDESSRRPDRRGTAFSKNAGISAGRYVGDLVVVRPRAAESRRFRIGSSSGSSEIRDSRSEPSRRRPARTSPWRDSGTGTHRCSPTLRPSSALLCVASIATPQFVQAPPEKKSEAGASARERVGADAESSAVPFST